MEFNRTEWFVLFFIILTGVFISAFHLASFLFTAIALSIQSTYIAVKDIIGGKGYGRKQNRTKI